MLGPRSARVAMVLWMAAFGSDALAAPLGTETCRKMIAEGRNRGMSEAQCRCRVRVAETVLDWDIKVLLLDAWRNGTNNLSAFASLPNQPRVYRQLGAFERRSKRDCL